MKKTIFCLLGILLLASATAHAADKNLKTAIFAGGCFWCVESDFDKVPGVTATTSGYTGGKVKDPTYKQVSDGDTGHKEAVRVEYDPKVVSYARLLDVYWHSIDPLDPHGQFCDKGDQYQSAIFYANDQEKALAEKTRKDAEKALGQPVSTQLLPASDFYPAEEYHQDYHTKNPIRYSYYRSRCGRDERVREVWGAKAHAAPKK